MKTEYPQKGKRVLVGISLLVLFAMLLAACGGGDNQQENGTAVPNTAITETGGTEEAMGASPIPGTGGETETVQATQPEATVGATQTAGSTQTAGAGGQVTVGLKLLADGFTSPLVMRPVPDGSGRLFVADQIGTITIIDKDGKKVDQPFLDLRDRMVQLDPGYDERGLLGFDFHPDFANNGRFYVYYSAPLRQGAPADWNATSHVSEFTVSADDPNKADPNSEKIILQVDEPQMNHNGGQINFGPDGFLYIPLGDGGGADDKDAGHVDDWYQANAGGNGQDITQNLLGSILRIDVDSGDPYAIPQDNPFVGKDGMDEIYAYGLRNPYRISFDSGGDHALYAGDAGQALIEEVDVIQSGGNYGWNVKEASSCFNAADNKTPLDSCPDTAPDGQPLIDPVIEFHNTSTDPNGLGNTVIGGNVYRGSQIPELAGQYVFGVWSTSFTTANGAVFVSPIQGTDTKWPITELQIEGRDNGRLSGENLLSFGNDANQELYLLTTEKAGPSGNTGKIYQIVPAGQGD